MLTTMIDLPKGKWTLSGSESVSFQSPDQSTIYAIEALSAPADNDLSIGVRISPSEIYSYKKTDGNLYLMSPSANARVTVASPGGIIKSGLEIDAFIQDQTTDSLVFKFFKEEEETTLDSNTSLFDRSIVVSDATGFSAGKLLHLIDTINERGMICQVRSTYVSGTTIPIDRPLDFAYTAGTKVILSSTDMAIDASSTESVFGIRTENYDVPEKFHFTRIRFTCITATAPEIDEFGDLSVGAAGVVKDGITIRKKNTTPYRNLVTFNSNLEMQGLLGHWTPFSAFNPGTGKYGFFAEWVLAGQENQGVANKVEPGDELEIVFKENFSGLTFLEAVAIGHIVKE